MILTDTERAMRDGAEGPAVAAAMDLLVRYGEALDAEGLCEVRNVAGTTTQPSPAKARLVAEGGWDKAFSVINLDSDEDLEIPPMAVPTCQLQQGFGPDSVGIAPYPADFVALQSDAEVFYGRRGVSILATCTPYQVGNLPVRGEHCAWMESSAVVYANSVLGARTNCEGTASTGAASLTGRVPCWGNHHDRHRRGTHLIRVDTPVETFQDWGLLGYFVGDVVQEARPVVTGAHALPDLTDLKHFGAAAASSGGVEMYHVPGVTPEAPTVEAAFGGERVPEPVVYDAAQRRETYARLNDQGTSTDVDFVLLGCPHASLDQIRDAARALEGRRLHESTQLWIMAPRALAVVAERSGYVATIEAAGGKVLTDSCPAMSRSAPPGTRVFATDSAKQAHYLPAILGIEAWFGTTAECVDAAVTGRWRGGAAVSRAWTDSTPVTEPEPSTGVDAAHPRVVLRGRTVVPGVVDGEALVSPATISGWGGIDPAAGTIIEPRHPLFGVCFTGKILVFPGAKGSSGWSGFFQTTRLLGTAPIGMIFAVTTTKAALGAVVTRVPALSDLDGDPVALLRTGDRIRLDATGGTVALLRARS